MPATREAYRPPLIGEKLVRPLTLCRAAVTGMAWAMATLGESVTFPSGRPYGNGKFRELLKRARENTGDPKRGSYNQSHVEAFLRAFGSPLKLKDVRFNKDRPAIREALKGHNVISMAGSTEGVDASSKLHAWVNPVGHQLLFFDWEGGWRTGTVAVIDPMTPLWQQAYVRRIPVRQMWQFGQKFRVLGRYVTERYRIGRHTKQAITNRNMAAMVLDVQTKLAAALAGWQMVGTELDEVIERYNLLDVKYRELFEGAGVSAAVEEAVKIRLQKALADLTPLT